MAVMGSNFSPKGEAIGTVEAKLVSDAGKREGFYEETDGPDLPKAGQAFQTSF